MHRRTASLTASMALVGWFLFACQAAHEPAAVSGIGPATPQAPQSIDQQGAGAAGGGNDGGTMSAPIESSPMGDTDVKLEPYTPPTLSNYNPNKNYNPNNEKSVTFQPDPAPVAVIPQAPEIPQNPQGTPAGAPALPGANDPGAFDGSDLDLSQADLQDLQLKLKDLNIKKAPQNLPQGPGPKGPVPPLQ